MLNKVPKPAKILIVILISLMPFGFIKTDFYFMSPGPPYQWDIEIEEQNPLITMEIYIN